MTNRKEHFIPRTPSEIWSIVTDWQVAEYWLGVSRLRPTEGRRAIGVGSVLAYDVRGMLHPMVVTSWEPPHHLGLSTEQGGITAHYDFRFTAEAEGTRVVRVAGCTGRSTAWRVAAAVLQWLMLWTDRKQLALLEGLVRVTTGKGH
jgi:hypothetical protein